MRSFICLGALLLLAAASCKTVRSESSELHLAANCNFLQQFGPLAFSCGNARCEALLLENSQTCPQDCLDPKTHVVSYYAQSHVCPGQTKIHEPKEHSELSALVQDIQRRGKGIKLIGTLHSITDIKCPDQGEVVAMGGFHKILGIEDYQGKKTVHLEANVRFWDLVNYLDGQGLALDQRIPGFGGISVAGFIATGAHGSNTKGSSSIASSIVSLEIMRADGSSQVYDQTNTSPDQWRALRGHLGLLGVLTRVRLEVRPRYNLATEIREYDGDILFQGDEFLQAARSCDFLFAHYMHGMGKVYFTCGNETRDAESQPGFANTLFLPPSPSIFDKLVVSSFQHAACSDRVALWLEKTISEMRNAKPWLTWKDAKGKTQHSRKGVGSWHRMMETIFDETTQPKFSQIDWEVAIPVRHFAAAMADMKDFMDRNNVIIPSIGVILRFDQVQEDSFMAPSAADEFFRAGEPLIHLEMPVYTPYGFNEAELEAWRKPYRDFFLHLIEAYQARPHFGKNDNALFSSDITKKRLKSSLERFSAARRAMDPSGTFHNDFMKKAGIN